MPQPLYLDTARFGSILPECAEMLREFATLLELEGQFPQFDTFLKDGSACWSDRLTTRFPVLSRWKGLEQLRGRVLQLCGIKTPATVLFASSSRHLARIAFQMLSHRCERVLCSDADWPDFQEMLRKQMAQSGGTLHATQLSHPFLPDDDPLSREDRFASAFRRHQCDGAFITAVAAEGAVLRPNRILEVVSRPQPPEFLVVDGAQQVGNLPIELGSNFQGIYLAGTHKWLRSGVPLAFGLFTHDSNSLNPTLAFRNAIRLSLIDDSLLLQTADIGLDQGRQTMRLEPLLAAGLAIEHVMDRGLQQIMQIHQRNIQFFFEVFTELTLPISITAGHGFVQMRCERSGFTAQQIQQQLSEDGLKLSVCGDERLRLSCPAEVFTEAETDELWRIFSNLSARCLARHQSESNAEGIHSFA